MNRRDFLKGFGAAVGAGALAGCSPIFRRSRQEAFQEDLPKPQREAEVSVRRLNRIGFGPTLAQLIQLEKGGWEGFVQGQLRGEQEVPQDVKMMLRSLDVGALQPADLRIHPEREVMLQLHQAALLQALYSPNQLRERMVDFWTDHFNIDAKKAYGAYALAQGQQSILRENALGNFPEMLKQTAHSPAMLAYLDNSANKKGQVNENYGRELLELHTLGVHGGYSQRDVLEVSRCFTGWTIENRFLHKKGSFRFDPELHEPGAKFVLGRRIESKGKAQGDEVLDLIAHHPSTAQHLSKKLCDKFMGAHSNEALQQAVAKRFRDSGGSIREMLEEIVFHSNFGAEGAQLPKRPFDFVISALRAVDAVTTARTELVEQLIQLKQPLYQWPMPDGYPLSAGEWNGTLMARWQFAAALACSALRGVDFDLVKTSERAGLPVRRRIAYTCSGRLTNSTASIPMVLFTALSSPEFQWR